MGFVLRAKLSSPSCLLLETSAALRATLTTLFFSLSPVDALPLPPKNTQTPVSKKPVPWITKSKAASRKGMALAQLRLPGKRGLLSSWGPQDSAGVCPGVGATTMPPCRSGCVGAGRPTALGRADFCL